MSTYEVNIGGEVDPRLKKGIKDVAKEAKGLSKATDEVKESVHEMSSESKASVRDLARISSALADLRAATRGLTRAQQDKQRITAAAMRLHAQSTRALNMHAQAVNRTSDFYVKARKNAEKLGVELRRVSHAGRTTAFVAAPFKGIGGGGGAGQVSGAMVAAARGTDRLNQSVGRLKSSWASIITAFNTSYFVLKDISRAFFDLTDGVIRFQNQIRQSTTSTHDFNKVMSRLRKVSRETGVSIGNIGLTFQRLRIGLDALALPPEKLLGWTEALTRTMAAFGLGASEAGGAIRQFTQGLASGTLRGHELYSVLEQLPPLAQEIARHLGVFTSDLRELAAQGKITQDVLMAAMDRLEVRAAKAIKLFQLSPKQLFKVGAEGFADLFTKFMEDSGALNFIVGTMKTINDYMANIVERARAGEPIFQRLADTIKNVAKVVYTTTLAITSFLAGAALVRFFSMLNTVVRNLMKLGAMNIFGNILKGITSLAGGGLGKLALAGLAGAGVFTAVDHFVNRFLEKINETIEPAVREFEQLMKERDSVLGQTQNLTEMLWALRRKDPTEYGVQELIRIRKMIQDVNALRDEMERKAIGQSPWQVLGMTGGLAAPWAAQLAELQEAEERALANVKKINEEAQKLPTQIRNFFKMIKEGAFETNKEINKIAANFEKKIVTGRIQTGKTGMFQRYLEQLRQAQEDYPAETSADKRRRESEKKLKKDFDYLFKGRKTRDKFQFPVYSGHPRHAPPPLPPHVIAPGGSAIQFPDLDDLREREAKLAKQAGRAPQDPRFYGAFRHREDELTRAQKLKVFKPDEFVLVQAEKYVQGYDEIKLAHKQYNKTLLDSAVAERDLGEIQRLRLEKLDPNLYSKEENALKKIIRTKEEMLKYDLRLKKVEQDRVATLRRLSRSAALFKTAAPSTKGGKHFSVGKDTRSFIDKSGRLALLHKYVGENQREGIENFIRETQDEWANYTLVGTGRGGIDLPFEQQRIKDTRTDKYLSKEEEVRAKEARLVSQYLDKQVKQADKVNAAVKRAHEESIQFTNTVGGSMLNAFKEVANAANLFGDKWGYFIDVVIDQVGKLIIEMVAAKKAAEAAAAAQKAGEVGLEGGYKKRLTHEAGKFVGEAATEGVSSASYITAGISIGAAFLATLFKKDSKRNREEEERRQRDNWDAALRAYAQRQQMLILQRRTANAVEKAERIAREEKAKREIAEGKAEALELRSFRAELAVHSKRLPDVIENIGRERVAAPAPALAPALSLVGAADDQFGGIRDRFAADSEDIDTRRRRRESPPPPAPAAAAPEPAPVHIVVVDGEEQAEAYARSERGRKFILNALDAHRGEARELMMSTGGY